MPAHGSLASGPGGSAAAQISQFMALVVPPPPGTTSDVQGAWRRQRKQAFELLRAAGEPVGLEALKAFEYGPDLLVDVRQALLDVAAHAAPAQAAPVLERVFENYEEHLAVRRSAIDGLAVAAPERAYELVKPLLLQARKSKTYPDQEFLLQAWLSAARTLSADPSEELAAISTDLYQQDAARHAAVEELGKLRTPIARQALIEVLSESTGNSYLRRKAAQSLRDSLPQEEACAIFRQVLDREADDAMLLFLADMLERSCK